MQNSAYRLGEYKIIENEHGDLWWESHIGLGSLKSGKCFINGNILFIKPTDSAGPGFLKGEFLDHLNKLPKWEKTKYYCASYKIYKCKSGSRKSIFKGMNSRLRNEAIIRKNGSTQREDAKSSRKSVNVDTADHISYKLRWYEIIEKNNGQLFWKSHRGLGRFKRGPCHIKGSILFFEPGETELSILRKKEFLQQLIHLPDWQRTKYFCPRYAIYYCTTSTICRKLGKDEVLKRDETKNVVTSNKTFGTGIKIKPAILNKITAKDKLKTLFNFCKLLVTLILKLLLRCFQMVCKVFRVLIGRWTQFRG